MITLKITFNPEYDQQVCLSDNEPALHERYLQMQVLFVQVQYCYACIHVLTLDPVHRSGLQTLLTSWPLGSKMSSG